MATASILAEVCGWPVARECPALAPGGGVGATLDAIRSEPGAETVGLVGHEPDLGQLLAYLLTGDERGLAVEFRKGGAAVVDFDGPPQPGAGRLISFVPPRIARRLDG